MRRAFLAVLALSFATGCAGGQRSYTPNVEVVEKGQGRKPAGADYRAPPGGSKEGGPDAAAPGGRGAP